MKRAISLAAVLVLFTLLSARADVMAGSTNRTLFDGNDFVDWGVLGPENTVLPNPFTVNSNGGLGVDVSEPSGNARRVDQSPAGGGGTWNGNFAPGDELIWTENAPGGGGSGPVTMDFALPIFGGGAQIQINQHFGQVLNFVATIDAYDGGTLLGTFTEDGLSQFTADNTAIFIGIQDLSGAGITRLVINATGGPFPNDFAINRLDLLTSVPEPSSYLLLLTALGIARGAIRRKIV
jgi:hypothetical protein